MRQGNTHGRVPGGAGGRRRAGRPASARRGFTLIEVLVALAIFAMAAVLLGSAYVNVLTSYHAAFAQDRFESDLRAVRDVVLAEPDPKLLDQGGQIDLPGGHHADWKVTLDPTQTADLHKVTLEVGITGPDIDGKVDRTETFLALRPTWSDAAERSQLMDADRARITQMNQERK